MDLVSPPSPTVPTWRALVAGVALLLACTAGLASAPSTRVLGDDRVPDPMDDPSGWRLRGDDGGIAELAGREGIHLVSREGQRAVAWYDLGSLGDHTQWRLRGQLTAPRPARVKIVLAATDGDRRLWFGSYGFESDTVATVDLPVNAPLQGLDVSVGVRMRGDAGEAWLHRMDLEPVTPRIGWRVALVVLALGWLVAWVGLVRRVGLAAGGIVLTLGAGVTAPRAWVDVVLGRFTDVRILESPAALWLQKFGGHGGTFALLGAVLASRFSPRTSLAVVLTLGVASEALQLVSIARSASLLDVALDVVGGAIGVGAVVWWRGRRTE